MKKLLLLIAVLIITGNVFGQIAPITGPTSICLGWNVTYTDATTGGYWSTGNVAIATVGSATGIVSAVSVGTTLITYQVGAVITTTTITINPNPDTIAGVTSVCAGLKTILTDSGSGNWVSTNTSIATVGSLSGVVTAVTAGITNIIYSFPGTGCFTEKSVTVNPLPASIAGYTNVYTGTQTLLGDLTPGGIWSSGNSTIATIVTAGAGAGTVTGVSSGVVMMTYTLPTTGCLNFVRVNVNPFPDSGLVAWYPFCNDLNDYSGNGYTLANGTYTGSIPATDTSDRFNVSNSAYYFNGVNSMINYTPAFPVSSVYNSFTYSCWIFPMAAQNSIIMYNGSPSGAKSGFGFMMDNGAGAAGTKVSVLFSEQTPSVYLTTDLVPLGGLNNWYNLLLLKNGNSYRFYINGNLIGFFILPTIPSINPGVGTNFVLGQDYNAVGTRGFKGKIDDVAIFNNQLSNQEITDILDFNPDAAKFTLGNDTTICSDSIKLFPTPQTLSSAYYWSTGDTTDTAIMVSPIASRFFGSQYILTIQKPFGCRYSDTIVVFKALMPVNLGPDTNICLGDTILLGQNAARGTNYFPGANFLWSNGDTTHSIRVSTTGTFSVVVDSGACVGRDTINVHTRIVPKVNLGPDVAHCNGKIDTITNAFQSFDSGYAYSWSVGTTNDSLIVNTSGTYWLKVTDTGCSRSDTVKVLIIFDTLTLVTPDTAICKGAHVIPNVTINPINPSNDSNGIYYQWTPTAGIPLSNILQPTITPDTSATYVLTARYHGCPDVVDSIHIDVQPNPYVYIGGNQPLCEYDTLHIHASVTPAWYTGYIYNWTPSNNLDYNNIPNVIFTAYTGHDSTYLFLTVTTSAGCKGKDSAQIFVFPGHYDTAMTNFYVCPGDSVQLIPAIYDSLGKYGITQTIVWHPAEYLNDSVSNTPWVHAITNTEFTGIATSQHGCLDTITVTVNVKPAAIIYFPDSTSIHPGGSYHIPTQTNCVYFAWFPPYGLDDTTKPDPTASPTTNTKYIVHATSEQGCEVIDSININVNPYSIINVPNAFSPGFNINGTLMVNLDGIPGTTATLSYLRIYNRWGQLVFETNNIQNGWDGTFNGKPQPSAVYVYEAQAVTNLGQVFTKQGNITLIR